MFFVKKIAQALFVLWGVVTLSFVIFQLLGDPVRLMIGQSGDKKTLENIRKSFHLDQPKWKQYTLFINDVSFLSVYNFSEIKEKDIKGIFIGPNNNIVIKLPYFGKSYQSKKNVIDILSEAIPATFLLAFFALFIASVVGIFLGVVSAINKNKILDYCSILISTIGISAPSFFIAILIAWLFGIKFHSITGLNFTGSLYEINDVTGEKYLVVKNIILPAITLGIRPLSIITQLTRSSMLDVLNKDFVRTAYAKGLNKTTILFKHALKNAIMPVFISITGWFAELLAGAFFVEFIFGWNGLGKITVDALTKLDYPVVIGAIIFSASIFIIINILSDYVQKKINPMLN